jgi:hypothetical protein
VRAEGVRPQRVDFLVVAAHEHPDYRTIGKFRKRHEAALSGLFKQVLQVCANAGLVKLGHVAIDGTKVRANASKHKAMSYKRMKSEQRRLGADITGWFTKTLTISSTLFYNTSFSSHSNSTPYPREAGRKFAVGQTSWSPLHGFAGCPRSFRVGLLALQGSRKPLVQII